MFDNIGKDDLVMAFFPCIKFCSVMEQMQHEDFFDASQRMAKDYGTTEYFRRKWATLRKFSQERFYFYDIALKMYAVAQIKGFRMIMENPWHPTNFTNHFWFARVSLVDNDRTRRGDYFKKPTAFWYINCEPTHGETYQPTPREKIRSITAGSGVSKKKKEMRVRMDKEDLNRRYLDKSTGAGLCDEERSMISPDYARNFICDFILGRPQVNTQLSLFE